MALKPEKIALKRTFTLKIRLNPQEVYLLNRTCEKLGFAERATTIRWLIEHEQNISEASEYKKLFEEWQNIFQKLLKK